METDLVKGLYYKYNRKWWLKVIRKVDNELLVTRSFETFAALKEWFAKEYISLEEHRVVIDSRRCIYLKGDKFVVVTRFIAYHLVTNTGRTKRFLLEHDLKTFIGDYLGLKSETAE